MQRHMIIRTLSACADSIDKMALEIDERGLGENDSIILMDISRNISNVISYINMGDGDHKLRTAGLLLLGILIGVILTPGVEAIFRVFS